LISTVEHQEHVAAAHLSPGKKEVADIGQTKHTPRPGGLAEEVGSATAVLSPRCWLVKSDEDPPAGRSPLKSEPIVILDRAW